MKSKGPALLSELVANSMEEIENYRVKQQQDHDNEDDDDGSEVNDFNDGVQTYVNNQSTINQGTIRQNPQKKKQAAGSLHSLEGEEVDIGTCRTILVENPLPINNG